MPPPSGMFYLGIDPGVSGAITALDERGLIVGVTKMPETERDLLDCLFLYKSDRAFAVLERVGASPQMGVVSAFTFGRGYGRLLMGLTASRIPFDQITPRTWQTALSCLSGGDKNITKRRAQQLFPAVSITHAIADSLLLAEYCRRLHVRVQDPTARAQTIPSRVGTPREPVFAERGIQSAANQRTPPHGKEKESRQEETASLKAERTKARTDPREIESAVAGAPRYGASPRPAPR